MLPPLTNHQRCAIVARYNLPTTSPSALLAAIAHRMKYQAALDPYLVRLLAVVAAIPESDNE